MPVMDSRVNGSGVDDRGKLIVPAVTGSANYGASYIGNASGNSSNSGIGTNGTVSGYTLMVAGQRTGKTSFLRLLLDTSEVSRTVTTEQLASVAKFVQGCGGHTSHIRTASIDVKLDADGKGGVQPLALTLVDTPSLDFTDESSTERLVSEMLRYVESRLAEGIDDEWKARAGDHHVHLCIYFLDPEDIVPPSVPGPPAPLVPRARTNSFSQPEPEPVILEPPLTTNPLLCRPTLPQIQTNIIRRLSARVNVLPVVARADTLTNDRLAAIRLAIRRDLAEAGIGFGIFDTDNHPHAADSSAPPTANGDLTNGYASQVNGSKSSPRGTSPTSPSNSSILRLPYALISPDIYSHSDGVPRVSLPRHELIHQYTPSNHHAPPPKLVRGKFVRNYRWGPLDVLDPNHSDFLALRTAVFHHMETLQKYTREYLFDKFRVEYTQHHQRLSSSHHSLHHNPQGIVSRSQLPPLPITSRPVLAIDTAPPQSTPNRHTSLSVSREAALGRDILSNHATRGAHPDPVATNTSARVSPSAPKSTKQRTKKITVACNFCRSRKLKCDGGRPACAQCIKRSNPCDYQPQNNKRRGAQRNRKHGDESDSDMISGDDPSADPSLSPEISSRTVSRKNSNVERRINLDAFNPNMAGPSDHILSNHLGRSSMSASADSRPLFRDNELPHIATLSLPGSEPSQSMQGLLPPIRPASEQQAAQRKRASTVPGRSRATSNTGPKVVACNFCRARKTKCDGITPSCSSCARRSLPCNYNHIGPTTHLSGTRKRAQRSSNANSGLTTSPPAQSPPVSSHVAFRSQASAGAPDGPMPRDGTSLEGNELDLKRKNNDLGPIQQQKRLRKDGSPAPSSESLDSPSGGL